MRLFSEHCSSVRKSGDSSPSLCRQAQKTRCCASAGGKYQGEKGIVDGREGGLGVGLAILSSLVSRDLWQEFEQTPEGGEDMSHGGDIWEKSSSQGKCKGSEATSQLLSSHKRVMGLEGSELRKVVGDGVREHGGLLVLGVTGTGGEGCSGLCLSGALRFLCC